MEHHATDVECLSAICFLAGRGHQAGRLNHSTSFDHAKAVLRSIIEVGTSAGGALVKAVIAWNRETSEIRVGPIDTQLGFELWLPKFDGMGQDNEMGMSSSLAKRGLLAVT